MTVNQFRLPLVLNSISVQGFIEGGGGGGGGGVP